MDIILAKLALLAALASGQCPDGLMDKVLDELPDEVSLRYEMYPGKDVQGFHSALAIYKLPSPVWEQATPEELEKEAARRRAEIREELERQRALNAVRARRVFAQSNCRPKPQYCLSIAGNGELSFVRCGTSY